MGLRRRILLVSGIAIVAILCAIVLTSVSVALAPATCGRCHSLVGVVPPSGQGVHGSVQCVRCHGGAGFASRVQMVAAVPLMLIRLAPDGLAQVPEQACLSCHEPVTREVTSSRGLRIDHRACIPPGASCATCHDQDMHERFGGRGWARTLGMDECVACHVRQNASRQCNSCHEGRVRRDRLKSGVWQLTHGEDWRKQHGLGGTRQCVACHEGAFCARCHEIALPHDATYGAVHGREAVAQPDACATCHDTGFCDDCHGMKMPHPFTFMKNHAAFASSTEDERCLVCHEKEDCSWCHDHHVHPGGARLVVPSRGGGS